VKAISSLMGALLICFSPALAQDVPESDSKLIGQAQVQATVPDGPKNPITDEQRTKLGAIKDQYELDTAQSKAQLKVSQRQLRQMLMAPSVDKSAALSLQGKINTLRASLSDAKLKMMLASSDVFTPEQKAAFKKFRGHGHGMGKGRHGGGGKCGAMRGHGRGGHHGGPGGGGPRFGMGGPEGPMAPGPGGPGGPGGFAGVPDGPEFDLPDGPDMAFMPPMLDGDGPMGPPPPGFDGPDGPEGPEN
jgi:Spy/CpxP family protein refolding chaperone